MSLTETDRRDWIGLDGMLTVKNASDRSKPSGMLVPIQVMDAKSVFGRLVLKVTPTRGSGELWVNRERCTFEGE